MSRYMITFTDSTDDHLCMTISIVPFQFMAGSNFSCHCTIELNLQYHMRTKVLKNADCFIPVCNMNRTVPQSFSPKFIHGTTVITIS